MNPKHLFRTGWIIAVLLTLPGRAWSADPAANTNRIARWLSGRSLPHLTAEQAEAYVQQHQRRPEALLAACQASGNRAFLQEAIATYPRDKRVAMAAAFQSESTQASGSAEERRRSLDHFKSAAPDNALAYYLSAREYFKAGQPALAEKDAQTGAGKPIRDYAIDLIDNATDAYLSAGYSEAEATALAMGSLIMPHLARLKDLGSELVKRAAHYRQGGDAASSGRMLQAAIRMGAQIDSTNSFTILQNLVGIAIQETALKELVATAPFGNTGRTVQGEIDRLHERRADLRTVAREFNVLFEQMPDKEIGSYFNQQKRIGEEAADRQALAK